MAGHRAGVAEAQVDVVVAVDVGEVRALASSTNRGKPPAHLTIQFIGTPARERPRTLEERERARMLALEALELVVAVGVRSSRRFRTAATRLPTATWLQLLICLRSQLGESLVD